MMAGAVIGGVAGVYLGEEVLGQRGDFPHGWDMLVGGGIGATVGALIARSYVKPRRGAKPRKSVAIVPVVSASRKAVFVTIPLK